MELLKELCEAHGAPGFEDNIRAIFRREIEPFVDRIEVDGIGNCIAIKEGKPGSPKVMLAGHLDEIGFVVKHIDDNGFLRLSPLGGFDPKTLIAKRVLVNTSHGEQITGMIGCKPIHIMTPEDRQKMPTVPQLFVDVSLTADEAREKIEIGDPVTLKQNFETHGSRCTGKSLDNRVSIYTLIESVKRFSNENVSVYAVATTQEEVGLRGAMTASHRIEPDCGVAIDVTLACDIPGATDHEQISALGKGVAIKIHDSSSISNPEDGAGNEKLRQREGDSIPDGDPDRRWNRCGRHSARGDLRCLRSLFRCRAVTFTAWSRPSTRWTLRRPWHC